MFDFDPARTLIIYDTFANDLYPGGAGDSVQRQKNIKRLLNFFPVIGEDEEGKMVELDAAKVLSIPRKIKSAEVVRRGFMSNFLFRNIGNIFNAPKELVDIINRFNPVSEPKAKTTVTIPEGITDNARIDEDGNVTLDDEFVIGEAQNVFGDKIYETLESDVIYAAENINIDTQASEDKEVNNLTDLITEKVIKPIIEEGKAHYGNDMSAGQVKRINSELKSKTTKEVRTAISDFKVKTNTIEAERQEALNNCHTDEIAKVKAEFEKKQQEAESDLRKDLAAKTEEIINAAKETVIERVETDKREKDVQNRLDEVRDRLRGFSRTIPSFLMAYGDDRVTLYTFDEIIPDAVFQEVTSVTLEQFRLLRDGFDYEDKVTGKIKHQEGFFDQVVFDDSVKEFLRLKKALADYFDEAAKEDIFDYIPSQKTNQIFTPKKTVQQMVDMLEKENPGCFNRSDKTFIDLYMKSGLYITEIVKRLYNGDGLKAEFPDGKERLKHIFENQVYGLAPTEIIYKIATNYILGFDENTRITKHNFRHLDALPYAKDGSLNEKLDELFGQH